MTTGIDLKMISFTINCQLSTVNIVADWKIINDPDCLVELQTNPYKPSPELL